MTRVQDLLNTVYELDKKLGEGGQGDVYSLKGGKRAVKLIKGKSEAKRELLRRKLTHVRLLFEVRNLAIAQPLEMLKPPHVGYVMELLTGMTPISKLIYPPKNTECLVKWYLEGGGLKRRLILLAKTAEILAKLHSKGLVYADPSPNNIFISEDPNYHEIRLIDADNLCYESDTSLSVYTPGYGAPELIKGKSGVNTLTDAHAFAVIAFQTLTNLHPLIDGDLVNNGDPELEEKALQGEIPWIDHIDDHSNSTNRGFPREIVLSPNLRKLAQKSFREGLLNPQKRPGMSAWVETLYSASDFTITCPDCNSTYYGTQKNCSWCDYPRPNFVRIEIYNWHPYEKYNKPKLLQVIALEKEKPLILTKRITNGRYDSNSNEPDLEIIFEGDYLKVKKYNPQTFILQSQTTKIIKEISQDKASSFPLNIGKNSDWLLHFSSLDFIHRYASFRLIQGGK
jgi:eukaryotic-like serine/threonine-protein kinase